MSVVTLRLSLTLVMKAQELSSGRKSSCFLSSLRCAFIRSLVFCETHGPETVQVGVAVMFQTLCANVGLIPGSSQFLFILSTRVPG
jgi:hypothetical protein